MIFLGRRHGGTGIVAPDGHEYTPEELDVIVAEVEARRPNPDPAFMDEAVE